MANALAPAEWKKLLKDHKDAPDTAPLTKALDAYAAAEPKVKDVPQPVLDSLEKVVDAAKSARAANFKDKKRKPVVDFLDDVLKDAATMKVKAERFLQEKNERDREGEDGDEGGGNEGAMLAAQLIKVKKLDADAAKGFALALGGKAHGLVISKTPAVSGDHKKRARAMRDGNGKIFTGLVYGESGKYVFQLEEKPPNGLAKAIKKTATVQSGLKSVRVILRGPDGFEVDDETDAEEMADLGTDPEEAATQPPDGAGTATDDEKARFSARVKELSPRIKEALAARGPFAGEIDKLRAAMWDLGTKARYGEALEVLARLEALLDRASAPGEPQGPGAEVLRRIAALTPRVKGLLLAKAPNAKEVGLAFSEAQALNRQRDFEGAERKLDDVEAQLGPAPSSPERDLYEGLLETIPADLQRLRQVNPGAADGAQKIVDAARGYAGQGDYARAAQFLSQAAEAIARAGNAARSAEARQAAPTGKVAASVLRDELQQVRMRAAQGIDRLATALSALTDPRAHQVADIITRLSSDFPGGMEPLLARLDAAVKEGDSARARSVRAEIQESAKGWLAFLQAKADFIRGCETNPLGIPIQIVEPIRATLRSIVKVTA